MQSIYRTEYLLPGAAVAAAFYYVVSLFASWFRLRRVPGPFWAAFSHLWLARVNLRGISHIELLRLKKYGPVVRIAPNYVLTDDPVSLRRISGARSKYGRDVWWKGVRFDPRRDNMFTTTDVAAHDHLKAQTANAYNGRDHVDIEGGINSQLSKLTDLIRRHYLSRPGEVRKADLIMIIRYFTMDSISALAYGEPFGYLEANEDLYDFNTQVQSLEKLIGTLVNTPIMRNIISSPFAPGFMPKITDKKGIGRLIAIGQEWVEQHFDTDSSDSKDMVASFMRHGLSREQCESECVVQIVAGAATTGTAICSTLMFVIGTPRVYSRFMKEMQSAVDAGLVSEFAPIKYEQGKKLSYLQAIIYEAIRMRPSALYGHFKSVPPGGDTVAGVFLPGGTAIGPNIYGIMMSTDIFGEDIDIFRPERFADCKDEAQRTEMERAVELAFGSGRWMCAGKLVAWTQITKVVFELLRTFDFQPVHGQQPWTEQAGMFWYQRNMLVRIAEFEL